MSRFKKKALIIGAGPAGLTAAYELLQKTDIQPVIFEASGAIGGLSQTVNYKGNRMDIGGHRFFSKSDRVMNWWLQMLPLQRMESQEAMDGAVPITYRNSTRNVPINEGPDPDTTERVMLIRRRLSRILYLRKLFDYPIRLSQNTVRNLGLVRMIKIGLSYFQARLFPIKDEQSLEDFYINRFGRELYLTFFKSYTEKVWGVSTQQIKPDWGAQRVKGLSISKAISHALRTRLQRDDGSLAQKQTETSLIERFMYPKLGPGQLWESVAEQVQQQGAEIHFNAPVVGVQHDGDQVIGVQVRNSAGEIETHTGDVVFSTMPIKELIQQMHHSAPVPKDVQEVANGLVYRDFITVGLLLNRLTRTEHDGHALRDNWIYVQEPDVQVGRIQIFNNWSPYLVNPANDPDNIWLGLEYFCNEGDALWQMPDAQLIQFAAGELAQIKLALASDVLDATVIRMPKTYPGYFGSYERFSVIQDYLERFENLFLIGRNGMHRYNNQDHSMLTAMTAVENIVNGVRGKSNIWSINVEQDYHEEKDS